jgi:hypothetical protein
MEKIAAQAEKERTAAQLNAARASKFEVEAASDPDASYERVEQERIAMDKQDADRKAGLEREKFEHQKKYDAQQLALKLTEMDQKAAIEKDKAKAAAAKPKPAAGKPKPKK